MSTCVCGVEIFPISEVYMKIQVAGSLALLSCLVMSGPAFSLGFDDLLRGYLNVGGGTTNTVEQNLIKSNFDTKQAQLNEQLSAGVTSGQLNSSEESELRADLSRIASLQTSAAADGKYDTPEVQNILNEYGNFSIKLQNYLTNTATTNGAAPMGYNNNNWYRRNFSRNGNYLANTAKFQADIDTKQAVIGASLDQGATQGTLSWNDIPNLRNELNSIADAETSAKADGRLKYSEAQSLINRLDALSTKVNNLLAAGQKPMSGYWGNKGSRGRNRSVDNRQTYLRNRILQGVRDGRLTQNEADKLFDKENKVAELQFKLSQSNSRLSFSEQQRLLGELNNLNLAITRELNDRQVR